MRGILAVCVCALLALAAAPNPSAQTKQPEAAANQSQTAPPIAGNAPTIDPIQPSEYYQPCRQNKRNYRSDLCAQWTAAQGAIDAAYWAKWGFWLSLVGLVGLIGTLYYTRKAVLAAEEGTRDADSALIIAERNADAAADQVKVAQETARRQLRPYLTVAGVEVERPRLRQACRFATARIKMVNNGQTPATVTRMYVQFLWHANDLFTTLVQAEKETKFRVHRGKQPTSLPFNIAADGAGLDEPGQLLAFVMLSYTDVFDEKHGEPFAFQLAGEDDEKVVFNGLDLPAHMNHFPMPDYCDLFGVDENFNPKRKPRKGKAKSKSDGDA